jgi:hypothetical protein
MRAREYAHEQSAARDAGGLRAPHTARKTDFSVTQWRLARGGLPVAESPQTHARCGATSSESWLAMRAA